MESPFRVRQSFSIFDASEHYSDGGGTTVYLNAGTHMSVGGGAVFDISDFASDIKGAIAGVPQGSVVYFESNTTAREEFGFFRASANHSYYRDFPYISENSYVWGNTSAAFQDSVVVLGGGLLRVDGQIRPMNETFDFDPQDQNWLIESGRSLSSLPTFGLGYDINFVGDGKVVNGFFFGGDLEPVASAVPQCFPAETQILVENGRLLPICEVAVGQRLLSFNDRSEFRG